MQLQGQQQQNHTRIKLNENKKKTTEKQWIMSKMKQIWTFERMEEMKSYRNRIAFFRQDGKQKETKRKIEIWDQNKYKTNKKKRAT